ncbi:9324_t:CDS:2 [Diversispora eburnea]|uniref:9324_t:CDS:1 n=1 Tax=Diversispora eburnea TaxID=1213867 RepID=A0A9N9B6Y5_9GLOM|nr:9324_t:CDS:2 [Diversispora eburnea]
MVVKENKEGESELILLDDIIKKSQELDFDAKERILLPCPLQCPAQSKFKIWLL